MHEHYTHEGEREQAHESERDERTQDWPSDWCWADDGAIEFAAA